MSASIRIMLVDDHRIFRDGIRSLLNDESDIEIIAEAASGSEALEKLKAAQPDVLVLDISMQGMSGIDLANIVSQSYPDLKMMVLSMHADEEFVLNASRAGVKGYLPKDTSKDELLEAIRTINRGGEFYSKMVSEHFMKSFLRKIKTDQAVLEKEDLTPRELEILKLAAGGMSNKEIAEKLCISSKTVDTHKNHIMQKLHLKNATELVLYAIRNNIIVVK
jgi:DNA-binding NarL/FixJ family response regulator